MAGEGGFSDWHRPRISHHQNPIDRSSHCYSDSRLSLRLSCSLIGRHLTPLKPLGPRPTAAGGPRRRGFRLPLPCGFRRVAGGGWPMRRRDYFDYVSPRGVAYQFVKSVAFSAFVVCERICLFDYPKCVFELLSKSLNRGY